MASNIIESLNQLRLQNTGCDVIFEIGHYEFPAHRLVLMARMEYFKDRLIANTTKKKKSTVPLSPKTIDSKYFDEFLDYIYTSKIEFTDENIRAIYKTAEYFHFDELTQQVKEYMEVNMNIENVGFYLTIAIEFGMKSLQGRFIQFIFKHIFCDINKLSREKLIPSLSLECLEKILEQMKRTERLEAMFHYSVDWIAHHRNNDFRIISKLLEKIPLEKLSFDFLSRVVSQNSLIREDKECLNLLLNAFITVSKSHVQEVNKLHTDKLNKVTNELNCRIEEASKFHNIIDELTSIIHKLQIDSLYAIGGRDEGKDILCSVSEYNSTTCEWAATTPMPSPRSHFGCAVIGHKIYVCGGMNSQRTTNELTVFDTHTRVWTRRRSMKHRRQMCAAAVLNGQIYVAGGYENTSNLSWVERYCVKTDRWEYVAPMTIQRNGLELVAFNGFLYAIGGINDNGSLNIVERYDPQTNQWTVMNSTNNTFVWFGSAVWNGNIYIVERDKCEVYSPADDKWTEMPALSKCGRGRRLAVYDNKLYAIGGMGNGESSDRTDNKTVEIYDFEARVWRRETDLDVGRHDHGVAVVERL